LNQSDKAVLTAVSDLNMQKAERIAKEYHVPHVATDYHDILKKVDAVIVCTPNKFHAEITIAALEAGCHVLCEKPMAMNVAECEKMIEASRKEGKLLSIAYHYRHT